MKARGVVLALCVLSFGLLAHAQQTGPRPRRPTGSTMPETESFYLGGRVLTADRMQPVPRVMVTLLGSGGQRVGVTFTDNKGEFDFRGLRRGVYSVEVADENYEPAWERVDLYLGSRRDTTILLKRRDTEAPVVPEKPLSVRELQIPSKAKKEFQKGLEELHEKKKPKQGIAHFRKAIEIYPDFDEAYVQWGLAHLQRREYAEAEEVLQKAITVYPENARAHMVLGTVYNEQKRAQEAVPALERAIELEPNAWQAHFELGRACLQLGQLEKGSEHAQRAHTLNPSVPGVHVLVYNLRVSQGNYRPALAEADEFLELFPTGPLADKVRQQREALRQHLARAGSAKP